MIYGIGAASLVTGSALLTYYQCCRRRPMNFQAESRIDPLFYVFEATLNYLKDYPESFQEEGIWRESGNRNYASAAHRYIVEQNKSAFALGTNRKFGTSIFTIHEALSTLKISLENNFLPQYFQGNNLLRALSNLSIDPSKVATILKRHIDGLSANGNVKEACVLHNLLYLGYHIQSEAEFNRMNVDNVAKLFAPHFMRMLGIPETDSAFEYEANRQLISGLLKGPLTSSLFKERFNTPLASLEATQVRDRENPRPR